MKEKREPKVKATFVCGNCKHEWEQECPEEALTDTEYPGDVPSLQVLCRQASKGLSLSYGNLSAKVVKR